LSIKILIEPTVLSCQRSEGTLKSNLTLAQKGFLLVAVPLAFELTCVGLLFGVWQESRSQTDREKHDREIVAEVNNILRLTMTTAQACLLDNALPRTNFQLERNRSLAETTSRFQILNDLVKDDPLQRALVAKAAEHLHKIDQFAREDNSINEIRAGSKLGYFVELNKEGHQFSTEMTKLLQAQTLRESAFHAAEASSQQSINIILLTLILSSISLAVGLAIYFNMQAARRLKVVVDSITRLSAGEYGSMPLIGNDEFAMLDQDIHTMAAKLLEATSKERAVVENALDVIFSIDTKGQFTAVNPAATKSWGYLRDQLLKMTISDLLVEEGRPEVIKQLREAAINQKPCIIEAQTIAANGSRIEQLWSVYWSKQEQTLFCVAHDISERKRVEKLKQEFVAMITHDLRTPLTSIKVMLELLSGPESELSPEWRTRVKSSEESSARLISLINDLLDLEKMQAGKLVLKPDICLIDDLIESSIGSVRSFADDRNIKISHQKNGLLVMADERRLIQVIVNLLSNAIKFSPRESTVNLSTIAVDSLVEVRVTDQGRGIPPNKLKGIFNRFEQIAPADTDNKSDDGNKKGTGLGLAICQEIIQAHGGQIGVESKEGTGSTFWLRLPAAE
jgi:PAS domain S-box-containing protein